MEEQRNKWLCQHKGVGSNFSIAAGSNPQDSISCCTQEQESELLHSNGPFCVDSMASSDSQECCECGRFVTDVVRHMRNVHYGPFSLNMQLQNGVLLLHGDDIIMCEICTLFISRVNSPLHEATIFHQRNTEI